MDICEEKVSVSTGKKPEFLKRFRYEWTIHNFSSYDNARYMYFGQNITSPLLRTSNSNLYLMVYPHGFDDSDFVAVQLKPEIGDDFTTESEVNFFILDSDMTLRNKKRATFVNNKYFMSNKFIRRKELHDDSLTIVCKFTKLMSVNDKSSNNAESEIQTCRVNASLSNDLYKLLQNRLLSDVTIVTNDKKLFAHKSILMARSPVFAAMLQNDMEEKIESEIQIKDFGKDVVSEMIQFIYTEKVANIKDHFQDLLCLANKYDIEGLKLLCGEFMLSKLTIENIIEVFLLSESQNCSVIRPKLLQFFIKNSFAIIQSSQFESRKKDLPTWCLDMIKAVT